MPTTKQQRRRALELLEASIDGCTEAIMLAYGFKTELLVELVNAGLATATIDRMVVGGRRVKVIRMRITAAGRRALAKLPWPRSPRAQQAGYHSDPAILRYAALQSPGTSRAFLVTRTAGLTFRLRCRTYGGARTNALAIGNNVCIGWHGCCLGTARRKRGIILPLHE